MNRIKLFFAAATLCAATFVGYNAYQQATMTEEERLMEANIEALSSEEKKDDTTPCKDTGYKKWYRTSNIPTARREYFHDCFCNNKDGYDPVNC